MCVRACVCVWERERKKRTKTINNEWACEQPFSQVLKVNLQRTKTSVHDVISMHAVYATKTKTHSMRLLTIFCISALWWETWNVARYFIIIYTCWYTANWKMTRLGWKDASPTHTYSIDHIWYITQANRIQNSTKISSICLDDFKKSFWFYLFFFLVMWYYCAQHHFNCIPHSSFTYYTQHSERLLMNSWNRETK